MRNNMITVVAEDYVKMGGQGSSPSLLWSTPDATRSAELDRLCDVAGLRDLRRDTCRVRVQLSRIGILATAAVENETSR